jgi:hypothetical protein
MIVIRAGLAALLLSAATGAPAAAQDYVAERIVSSIGQSDLLAVVGSLGHQVREEGKDGEVYLAVEDPEGTTYLLFGTACGVEGATGCQGVMMQVRFDLPPGTTAQTVAAANLDQAAISVWADFENKTLGFTRYQVLDHGVTMANIRANIEVLLSLLADAYPIAAGES